MNKVKTKSVVLIAMTICFCPCTDWNNSNSVLKVQIMLLADLRAKIKINLFDWKYDPIIKDVHMQGWGISIYIF
jgi:hypothetical protein